MFAADDYQLSAENKEEILNKTNFLGTNLTAAWEDSGEDFPAEHLIYTVFIDQQPTSLTKCARAFVASCTTARSVKEGIIHFDRGKHLAKIDDIARSIWLEMGMKWRIMVAVKELETNQVELYFDFQDAEFGCFTCGNIDGLINAFRRAWERAGKDFPAEKIHLNLLINEPEKSSEGEAENLPVQFVYHSMAMKGEEVFEFDLGESLEEIYQMATELWEGMTRLWHHLVIGIDLESDQPSCRMNPYDTYSYMNPYFDLESLFP